MAKRRMAIIAVLFCLGLFLMPCGAQAVFTSDATEPISPERECTLTLSYIYNGMAFSNVPVKLYRVADISASAQYALTPVFAASGLDLNGIRSSGEWDVIRSTLEAHILANAITADFTAVTDQGGRAQFETLTPGLYFAPAGRVAHNGGRRSVASTLISLPGLGEDGRWQYQSTVTPKSVVIPPTGPGNPSDPSKPDDPGKERQYKVLLLWKDEDNRTDRPQSVDVELFRDGVSYQTVCVSEETNWAYTWTTKDDGADWMVVARNIPPGYTVTVEERSMTFILTSVLLPDDPSPEDTPPDDPSPADPSPDGPKPGAPSTEETPSENPPKDVSPTDSPKTGDTPHILLYTILMYVSGVVLVLLGITGKKKRV